MWPLIVLMRLMYPFNAIKMTKLPECEWSREQCPHCVTSWSVWDNQKLWAQKLRRPLYCLSNIKCTCHLLSKKKNHWLCANTSNQFRFFSILFWTLFTGAINSHMSYPNMFFHFMAEKFGDIFSVCENISCILLWVKSNICIDFCSKCLFIMLGLLFKAKMLPFLKALHLQPTQKNPIHLVEKYFWKMCSLWSDSIYGLPIRWLHKSLKSLIESKQN